MTWHHTLMLTLVEEGVDPERYEQLGFVFDFPDPDSLSDDDEELDELRRQAR